MLFRYVKRGADASPDEARELAAALGVMPATAAVLISRGIATPEEGRRFFESGMESLRDPFGLMDMDRAVARVRLAIDGGERIVVYGDYDVDGVCAVSILVGCLRRLGALVEYYIPSRHTEGYGLNRKAIESLEGARLLITVDCGISNAAEVARAGELGMDAVVTDHHECPDILPACAAVVNPKRPGQAYGFSGLCGAGVALKLAHALGGLAEAEQALDLAALATVADIVPLTDENLAIVRMGIERINAGARPGIQALRDVAGLAGKPVKSGNIAFMLAPRINAGGRMDLSMKSAEMMLTDDYAHARQIAGELSDDNAARMKVEEAILAEAVELVEAGYSFSRKRAIVLYRPHWNTGVTGIVASRLVERYNRPTILFGAGEGACYGSGRSVPGVHLYRAMQACSGYFLRFGGHEQAAGCALAEGNIPAFACAMDRYLLENYNEEVFLPQRSYDAELSLADVSLALARDMDRLEPTGFGNPRPVFFLREVGLAGLTRTADGKHLRMRFGGREGVEGIAFRQGGMIEALAGGTPCDALVVPDVNEWMGRQRVQAVVEHIRVPQGMEQARRAVEAVPDWGGALLRSALAQGGAEEAAQTAGCEEGLARFTESVRHSCWGTLALCFSAWSAGMALSALHAAGLLGRAYVCAGLPRQAVRAENAVMLAPDFLNLPLRLYENIYVFDGGVTCGCAAQLAGALNNGVNCIIIDEDYRHRMKAAFSRDELLRVYRAVKTALSAGQGPAQRGGWLWLERSHGIPAWQAEYAARVFIELGLVREAATPPWLVMTDGNSRTDLKCSAIYRRLAAAGGAHDEPEG